MSLVDNSSPIQPEVHTHNQFQSIPQTFSKNTEPEKVKIPQNKTESPISSAKEPNSNDLNSLKKKEETDNKIKKNDPKPETIGGNKQFLRFL